MFFLRIQLHVFCPSHTRKVKALVNRQQTFVILTKLPSEIYLVLLFAGGGIFVFLYYWINPLPLSLQNAFNGFCVCFTVPLLREYYLFTNFYFH